ncbi:MAG TPA: ABC transporter permease [Acidobacteriaceae bacterium]|nr:ABC transporter permease [Acidobacteriaceae bacterium]
MRQRRRKLLAGLAILLGTTAVTAMLAIGTSVGDKINHELSSAYGANIVVYPKADLLDVEIGGVSIHPGTAGSYIQEADLTKLKGIFWRNNITDISPELPLDVTLANAGQSKTIPAVGMWFHHTMHYGAGSSAESYTMGAPGMHPWWKLQGAWPADNSPVDHSLDQAIAGSTLAAQQHLSPGDTVMIHNIPVRITGIVSSGDATDHLLLLPLGLAQQIVGHPGAVRRVYVSALTKPEDALARRNPDTLPPALRDRWYCSPYANSIAFQIQEVLPYTHAEQIRRVAQGEGTILQRISGLMWLVALAALLAAAFAVAASMTTAILERKQEIGLMRALGATRASVANLFFAETAILALISGTLGYLLGSLLANSVGQQVFSSAIPFNPVLLPAALGLAVVVSLAGSVPSVFRTMRLDPAAVLREDA